MKKLITLLVAIPLAGCAAPALHDVASNNPQVGVELLFSQDGCDIYRFHDNGAHYFVRCEGSRTTATTGIPPGKGKRDGIVTTSAR